MKQCEIAKELGISKSYLSMILSGQMKIKPELAAKLSSQKVVNFEAGFSLRGRCPRPLDECAKSQHLVIPSLFGAKVHNRADGKVYRISSARCK